MKTRRLLCLIMVLLLQVSMHSYAYADSSAEPVDPFHVPTVCRMIENNLEAGNPDEEFFHALANAYLLSPTLFAEIISDFAEEEIQYLARAISYDLFKTGRSELASVPDDCETTVAEAVGRLIFAEVQNTENASIESFLDIPEVVSTETAGAELLWLDDMWLSAPALDQPQAEVFDLVQLSLSFGSLVGSAVNQQFTVKLYKCYEGETSLVTARSYTLLPGETSMSFTLRAGVMRTGVYTFYAELYNSSGNLLASSSVSQPITVYGHWRITVELPENRNLFGTLSLYNASGELMHTCICLGRSESGDDSNIYRGNTPIGECTGYLDGPVEKTYSYGPYKRIVLIPVSGQIKDLGDSGTRNDFLIHGGDPAAPGGAWYPLRPTYGCIRITNSDQKILQDTILDMINDYHYSTGDVSIVEIPAGD